MGVDVLFAGVVAECAHHIALEHMTAAQYITQLGELVRGSTGSCSWVTHTHTLPHALSVSLSLCPTHLVPAAGVGEQEEHSLLVVFRGRPLRCISRRLCLRERPGGAGKAGEGVRAGTGEREGKRMGKRKGMSKKASLGSF